MIQSLHAKATEAVLSPDKVDKMISSLNISLRQYKGYHAEGTDEDTLSIPQIFWERHQTGLISHRIMDVLTSDVFWCIQFLETPERSTSWSFSTEIRSWIYGVIALWKKHNNYSVSEYVRRGDHISQIAVPCKSKTEILHCCPNLQSDDCSDLIDVLYTKNNVKHVFYTAVKVIESEYEAWIPKYRIFCASMRYYIQTCAAEQSTMLVDYEVFALLASIVLSPQEGDYSISRRALCVHGGFQGVLLSTHLLVQTLFLYGSPEFPEGLILLDGTGFYTYLGQLKSGRSLKKMFPEPETRSLMLKLYQDIVRGLEDMILSFRSDFGFANKGGDSKRRKGNTMKTSAQKKLPVGPNPSNMYDILESL
jgi:hypothetical protein